jgi:hypothetical protein
MYSHTSKSSDQRRSTYILGMQASPQKTRRVRGIFAVAKLSAIVCGEGRIGVKECGCFIPNWMVRNVVRPHVLAISDLPLSGVLSLS